MAPAAEKSLIQQVQKGDLEAYGEIIRAYQDSVFSVCLRVLGHSQDAEDLTQDAFLRAYRNISHYDLSRPFGPWIRVLAANLCYNHLNKARLNGSPLDDERCPIKEDSRQNPEKLLELSQEQRELYQKIWQLPEKQRIALELRHFQGLSYQEMAQTLGLPLNTVRSHLYRARHKLAELLEEEQHD